MEAAKTAVVDSTAAFEAAGCDVDATQAGCDDLQDMVEKATKALKVAEAAASIGATAPAECAFNQGDGTGDSDEYLKQTNTKEECEVHVLSAKPAANGVTWGTANNECYAEYGMTGRKMASSWTTCLLHKAGNVLLP